ncbi:MAG TPA: membrane dipeptidase [Aggregatilineales bacterium]|nr:membrane dipeptidase [Aggregatilineales bacterium]
MPTDPFVIVDAHQDIASSTTEYGRDYTLSAYRIRQREGDSPAMQERGIATTGLPEALRGRIAVIFGTLFGAAASSRTRFKPVYETPKQAYKLAVDQFDVYERLVETSQERIMLIRTKANLETILATWAEGKGIEDHRLGIVVAMEGADPILEPKAFEEWYERGVRVVGLAWHATRYSGGTAQPGPLTPMGRELLEVMAAFNAILDLSHMAEEAYLEAVDRYEGQVIASHSNPRKFSNTDRQLSDAMIRRLSERDGVMGIVPYNYFLYDGWTATSKKSASSLDRMLAAMDHVCQITGSARHVGIGSDLDGGFGAEMIPAELDTAADLLMIAPLLIARGYTQDDVKAIMGGNFLRILRAALPG